MATTTIPEDPITIMALVQRLTQLTKLMSNVETDECTVEDERGADDVEVLYPRGDGVRCSSDGEGAQAHLTRWGGGFANRRPRFANPLNGRCIAPKQRYHLREPSGVILDDQFYGP